MRSRNVAFKCRFNMFFLEDLCAKMQTSNGKPLYISGQVSYRIHNI